MKKFLPFIIFPLSGTMIFVCGGIFAGLYIKGTLSGGPLALSLFIGAVAFVVTTAINGLLTASTVSLLSSLALTTGCTAMTAGFTKVVTAAVLFVASQVESDVVICVPIALTGALLGILMLGAIVAAALGIEKIDQALELDQAEEEAIPLPQHQLG